MNIYINPKPEQWPELQRRAQLPEADISTRVATILDQVKQGGDQAIRRLMLEIDQRQITDLGIETKATVAPELSEAIEQAYQNIYAFHALQKSVEIDMETMPGVRCCQRSVPIQRVGLYIPGGSAPLFSTVLMLAIPAIVAGCREIVLCTPAPVAPEILYTANRVGIRKIFAVSGVMAIGAMAYGTESIPAVDKIFGPGNQWVTEAKQQVAKSQVAIDMPAGPSEVMILADGSAKADFVAADMLSQAEHGIDSQAIAVCNSVEMADQIESQVLRQIKSLSRELISEKALMNCRIIVLEERIQMINFANLYAAEHLIIALYDPWLAAEQITAAGSVFIGNYSPESVGDYASGTNHTLPTYGWARSYSGVNLDSFVRKITYQELTPAGLTAIAPTVQTMATAEGLTAHGAAVAIRLKSINQ